MGEFPVCAASLFKDGFNMNSEFVNGIADFFKNGGFMIILMIGLLALMIIPQRKREKKVKEMLNSIKPGDRVRTIGGIYGTVTSVKDDFVTIKCGPDQARLVFSRNAIANVEDNPVENTMSEEVK